MPPKKRMVALPVSPSAMLPATIFVRLLRLGYGPDLTTCGNHPSFDVAPERDEQFACHGHNGDSPCAPSQRADALAKPHCQLAAGLVAKPEPCELDHGRPSTRVSGAANATI